MRPTYTIQATAEFPNDSGAQGLTKAQEVDVYMGEVAHHPYLKLPELGPPRIYDRLISCLVCDGLVLAIAGRRFKVELEATHIVEDDDRFGFRPGKVTFTETDEPETPYTEFDWRHAVEQKMKMYEGRLDQHALDAHATAAAKLAEGDCYGVCSGGHVFGQPTFIQNPVLPSFNGKAAYNLFTLDTGWGDSGNENYMVALDDDGYPAAVFYEASCY